MGHHNRHFAGDRYALSGAWSPPTSSANFCEEDYAVTRYFAEFINTLTNLVYVFFALRYMYGRGSRGLLAPKYDFMSVSLLVLGIASFLFHATLRQNLQFGDELAMLGLVWSILQGLLTVRYSSAYDQFINISLAIIFPLFALFYIWTGKIIYHVIGFAIAIGLIILRGVYLFYWREPGFPETKVADWRIRGQIALVLMGVAYILWNIDLEFCAELRSFREQLGLPWAWLLELHGWWHILTAMSAARWMDIVNSNSAMEPLSALALSGNVLQFIESAVKLLSEARQVCHSASGITTSNKDAITVYEDFRDAAGSLLASPVRSTTVDDLAVASLAERCQELSDDLVKDLKNLQAKNPGSKREGLRIAWRALREKGELESMEKRLDRYRQQILTRIIFMMSQEQSSTFLLLKECAQINEEEAKKSREQLESLRKELLAFTQTIEQCNQSISDKLQDQEGTTAKLSELISNITSTRAKIEKEDWILGKLRFSGIRRREDAIGPALAGTYRWLLYPPRVDNPQGTEPAYDEDSSGENEIGAALWGMNRVAIRTTTGPFREDKEETELKKETRMRFLNWLESGSGIFYLSGKPGSGKSTMMKFITREKRTAEALKTWAAGKQLVFSSFFFWGSGLSMQRSIEGLYRGLLWETLKTSPELIPTVFPRLWNHSPDRFVASISDMEFSMAELEEAFLKLTNATCDLSDRCVCFFIDGLDEFEGDHWKLTRILKEWTASPSVKICVSSRPYSDFENSFVTGPEACLRLHAHTYQDMIEAAKSELENDERLSRFQPDRHDYLTLAKSAVEKANGVFLWLRLALRHLLRGIGSQYSISQLEEIIQSMPNDVSDMFRNMLDKILARPDRVRAAITLLCLSRPALRETSRHYVLYFSVLDDVLDGTIAVDELIRRTPHERYSPSKIAQRIRTTESRLRGRCEDFVDVLDNPADGEPLPIHRYVGFVHRDLREFLVKDNVVEKLYKAAGWDPAKYVGLHRYVGVVLLRMVPSLASSSGVADSLIDDFHDSETTSTEELELLLRVITLNSMANTQEVRNIWRHCTILAFREYPFSPYIERKLCYTSSGPTNISSMGMHFITTAAFYRHNEFVLRLTTKHPSILDFNQGHFLNGGASPNLKLICSIPAWDGSYWTPWTATLLSLAGIIRRGELLDVLPDILELYLSHGADPTICFAGRYLPSYKLEPMPVWRVGPGIYAHQPIEDHIQKLFDHDDWYYLTLEQVVELLEHPKKEAIRDLLRAKLASQPASTSTGNRSSKPLKIANLGLTELGNCYFFVSMIVGESKLNGLTIPDEARKRLLPTGLIPI
ncbi:hypothetical protein O1611_g2333 [Lasiodiplodia mahajangana]|uniref:Uncharacterized protein n=1 Tax=Lasiodiplodia mahajangana TaxID=1108764 RepID=A0ACC2JVJ7_9PEZI|nr:hypothetical protein O1611_g2333 [Lasiodiplodia mahajangana]